MYLDLLAKTLCPNESKSPKIEYLLIPKSR